MPKSIFYQVGGLLTDLLSWEEQVYLLGNSTAAFYALIFNAFYVSYVNDWSR